MPDLTWQELTTSDASSPGHKTGAQALLGALLFFPSLFSFHQLALTFILFQNMNYLQTVAFESSTYHPVAKGNGSKEKLKEVEI